MYMNFMIRTATTLYKTERSHHWQVLHYSCFDKHADALHLESRFCGDILP